MQTTAAAALTDRLAIACTTAERVVVHLRYALDGLAAADTTDLDRWLYYANNDAHYLERLVHRLFADGADGFDRLDTGVRLHA
jgi:hypothetical protein